MSAQVDFLGEGIATAGMKALISVCRVRNNFDECNVGDCIVFLEDERYLYRIIKKELVPQAFGLRALQESVINIFQLKWKKYRT